MFGLFPKGEKRNKLVWNLRFHKSARFPFHVQGNSLPKASETLSAPYFPLPHPHPVVFHGERRVQRQTRRLVYKQT